ncbi:MAG TPA: hypothetical protein VK991_05870 [Halomonas sp.]|nr:hypothetical protein [Halomonas sp.]
MSVAIVKMAARHHAPAQRAGQPAAIVLWALVAGLLSLIIADSHAAAEQERQPPMLELDHVLVQTSLYTTHYSPDPEHNNQQDLISVELHNARRWLAGAAWFKNSFNQPSWYWYVGREFPLWEPIEELTFRAKLSAGLLRGYQGEYRDKIPFNRAGVAPAALPSVGLRYKRLESDLILYGTAGMMVTVGLRF